MTFKHERFQRVVQGLYKCVTDLEDMFPGRHFTPDGHMVGSIGESLVADAYDLTLMPASNQGHDAVTAEGKKVEIKATQAKSVASRSCPEHAIVIQIRPDGTFFECYNGPGAFIWQVFEGKIRPSNGQYQISVKRLAGLAAKIEQADRIPIVNSALLHSHGEPA